MYKRLKERNIKKFVLMPLTGTAATEGAVRMNRSKASPSGVRA